MCDVCACVHRFTYMCICGQAPPCEEVMFVSCKNICTCVLVCICVCVSQPGPFGQACVLASCLVSSDSLHPHAGSEMPLTRVVPGRFNHASTCPSQKPSPGLLALTFHGVLPGLMLDAPS